MILIRLTVKNRMINKRRNGFDNKLRERAKGCFVLETTSVFPFYEARAKKIFKGFFNTLIMSS
jgi:hypothetical protein